MKDKFKVPKRDFNSSISSEISQLDELDDRSSCSKFASSGKTPAGISPESLFFAKINRYSCRQFMRSLWNALQMELFDKFRFWSRGRLHTDGGRVPDHKGCVNTIAGNSGGSLLMSVSDDMRNVLSATFLCGNEQHCETMGSDTGIQQEPVSQDSFLTMRVAQPLILCR
nr:Os12g0235650 [Ipomoea batatas]